MPRGGCKFRSKETRKKISDSMKGKKNPAYKDGRRSYRTLAGAKPNDGKLVHHKNHNHNDNRKSNLTKTTLAAHNRHHKKGKPIKKKK